VEYGLRYLGDGEDNLHGYIDSYWESTKVDRNITSGCLFRLG
jgi:hypothetical protein